MRIETLQSRCSIVVALISVFAYVGLYATFVRRSLPLGFVEYYPSPRHIVSLDDTYCDSPRLNKVLRIAFVLPNAADRLMSPDRWHVSVGGQITVIEAPGAGARDKQHKPEASKPNGTAPENSTVKPTKDDSQPT